MAKSKVATSNENMMELSLGRLVQHDPRSRNFAYPIKDVAPHTISWPLNSRVLDQGSLRACTGFALAQLLNTERYWRNRVRGNRFRGKVWSKRSLKNADAIDLYSVATHFDEFEGAYPPIDTGSSGLGVAKAGRGYNYFDFYEHTFSYEDFLSALMHGPVLAGTNWYEDMFYPNTYGRISVSGRLRGGHEYVILGYNDKKDLITGLCAWSAQWGHNGRFTVAATEFERLLYEDGDITIPGVIL